MTEHHPDEGLTRRDLLKRGALAGAAVAWATPIVQVVGMSRAYAAPVSPGCVRYCMKWETDSNQPVMDGPDFELPCVDPDVPAGFYLWTSNWVAMGAGANQEEAAAVLAPLEAETTDGTTTVPLTESTLTTTTTAGIDTSSTTIGSSPTETTLTGPTVPQAGANGGGDGEVEGQESGEGTSGLLGVPATGSQGNGPPETPPGQDPEQANVSGDGSQQIQPAQVGGNNEGHCLTCPEGSVNDDAAVAAAVAALEIKVYGNRTDGFYVAFPESCSLAAIGDEGLDIAAAKCGPDCVPTASPIVEDDPCYGGFQRVLIEPCGTGHEISHIELILDCCS